MLIKKISLQMAIIALFFTNFCYTPKPAAAMTAEEFIKLFGVVDRYLQDIQRTFPSNPQPAPQPVDPTIPPNLSPDNTDPQPFSIPNFPSN
jgi:hypothetical protein